MNSDAKPRANPPSAVARLHTATPNAISGGRLARSPKVPNSGEVTV